MQCCTGLLFFLLFFSALACGRHAYQRQGRPCHQHWIYMQHPAHLPRCVSMTLLSYPSLCDIKLNFYRACFLSVREGGLISDRICHLQFIPSRVFLLSPWLSRWRTAGNTSWDPLTKVPLQLWQYLFLYFFLFLFSYRLWNVLCCKILLLLPQQGLFIRASLLLVVKPSTRWRLETVQQTVHQRRAWTPGEPAYQVVGTQTGV